MAQRSQSSFTSERSFFPTLNEGDRVQITVKSTDDEYAGEITVEHTVSKIQGKYTYLDSSERPFMAWQEEVTGEKLFLHSGTNPMEVTEIVVLP